MGAIRICKRLIIQAYGNKTLVILVFVPFIGFLISVLISTPSNSPVRVGVIDGDATELSASFIGMMERNDSFELFSGISDEAEMKDMLKNQDITIGLRINGGFYDNLGKNGAIQLFQTFDIETFRLVELYMDSSIDNLILLKRSTDGQAGLVSALDEHFGSDSLKVNPQTDENAISLFSSTAFGFLTMFMLLISVLSSKLIADDRFNTTLKRIFISPVGKGSYLMAGFLTNLLFQLIQVAVILAICLVMGFRFPIPLYSVAVIFVLFSVFASFFGMFISFVSKSVVQMLVASQMFMLPGMILCGAFFEFSLIPGWLQGVSFVFPQTWVAQTVNHFANGFSDRYFAYMFGYIALLCTLVSVYLLAVFKKNKAGVFY